jgi:hypothetical protein
MANRSTHSIRTLVALVIVAVLPAFAEPPARENVVNLPYFAVGGMPEGWHFLTVLSLENPDNSAISGTVEFLSTDGRPMHVQLDEGAALAVQAEWNVDAGESKAILLTHPGNQFDAGWLRVKSTRRAPLHAMAVIQFYHGDELVGEAGVLPGSTNASSLRAVALKGHLPVIRMTKPATGRASQLTPARRPSGIVSLGSLRAIAGTDHNQELRNVVETGYASWYGPPYHGRTAAGGKIYDQETLTAAHRTLPFGTRAKVTNLRNGRSVIVRIEDRGPFVNNRIVDLSLAAARRIDLVKSGISAVVLEVLPS